MAMNVGSSSGDDEVNSTINTTPLVDVMLVLLIIFLITIPVVTQSIAMSLPKETNLARQTRPENIEISVSKEGDVYWNAQAVADNAALVDKLKAVAVLNRHPKGDPVIQSKAETAHHGNEHQHRRLRRARGDD
jgi:biopolymer transport protein ExbD